MDHLNKIKISYLFELKIAAERHDEIRYDKHHTKPYAKSKDLYGCRRMVTMVERQCGTLTAFQAQTGNNTIH